LYLALFVVAVGIATALVHWAVSTRLLGANLATPVHATIVTLFLLVVAVAAYLSLWQGYRRLARWSRARGARRLR
jgi:protein-S-isoprenylcysteine O-methyltransferase Ste14